MRFIDDEQCNTAALQWLEVIGIAQPLGSQQHHIPRALPDLSLLALLLPIRNGGIEPRRLDVGLLQPLVLVLHESDQRGYHHHGACQE
jgi:hypothetical protein